MAYNCRKVLGSFSEEVTKKLCSETSKEVTQGDDKLRLSTEEEVIINRWRVESFPSPGVALLNKMMNTATTSHYRKAIARFFKFLSSEAPLLSLIPLNYLTKCELFIRDITRDSNKDALPEFVSLCEFFPCDRKFKSCT